MILEVVLKVVADGLVVVVVVVIGCVILGVVLVGRFDFA
jgi:hypothetical protein